MPHSYAERRWESHGLDCAVVVNTMGFRCGYVRIPRSHVLYGLEQADSIYGRRTPLTLYGRWLSPDFGHKEWPSDERLDYVIDAHGGITLAGRLATEGLEDGWWIGFDCAHAWDAKEVELMDAKNRRFHDEYGTFDLGGVPRSGVYVSEWCSKIAAQVAQIGEEAPLSARLRWVPRAIRGPRNRTHKRREPKIVLWGGFLPSHRQFNGADDKWDQEFQRERQRREREAKQLEEAK